MQVARFNFSPIIQNTRIINHQLYLLTTAGWYLYDLNSGKELGHYFENKNITDLLIDRKNNLWFSTSLEGMQVVSDLKVKEYNFDFIQPIRSLSYQNKLLISSKNEKVTWFNPTNTSFDLFSSGSANALPYYIYIDSLRNQLVRVQSDGFTYFSDLSSKKLLTKKINAIKKIIPLDNKYNAFVASGVLGFYCHTNDLKKSSKFDASIQKLEKETVNGFTFYRLPFAGRGKSLFFDKSAELIYFITNSGTFSWGKDRDIRPAFHANSKKINELFQWNNELYAFGVNGTIFPLNRSGKKINSQKNIIQELLNVKQVQQIDQKLYVRTSTDLWVYEKTTNGLTKLRTSFNLKNKECNDFSVIGTNVWIMTSNGFILWNVAQCEKNTKTGIFHLSSIKINGSEVKTLSRANLEFSENNIRIDFALLDYGIPTISGIEYKLNDQAWTNLDPSARTISFPALAPGNYQLQIRGQINAQSKIFEQISFSIAPPFWKSFWFIALVFLILALLITAYFKKQLKSTRKRNALINEKIVLESNLNKSLLASIKSQMNPHFIFNALNTIQAYIYMNDKENATGYLSKFSKLTRSVLEMSEKDEIQLSDDLNALRLYLDLEKMRFQDGFEYTFDVSNLDPEQVKIPSMLLQPYVENAIKHGLMHSKNDKKLNISIRKEIHTLLVDISDNGIGRKKSEELNKKREEHHEGFSTKANEKRLNLLNQNREISVVYKDNYSPEGESIGTTVSLKIQLKQ